MRREESLKQKLRQEICLSEIVEEKIQNAYSQIYAEDMDSQQDSSNKVFYVYRSKRKMVMTAVALGVAILGLTITGIAASVYFTKQADYTEETVDYKFSIDYELIPGEYEVQLDYIPEGYVDAENGKTSYTNPKEDDMYFTVLPIINTVELDNRSSELQAMEVENVEHMVLSGMETDIITYQEKDKYERPTTIYMFNPQEGYVVWIYGSYRMPVEELKKIADHLTVTRIGDSEERYLTEEEKEELNQKEQLERQKEKELLEKGVQEEQIVPLGESFCYPTVGYNGTREEDLAAWPELLTFTIQDVEVFEQLKDFDENTIFQYEECLLPWLNEDGSLKPYTRQLYAQDGMLLKEEKAEQIFMKVKVKMKYEDNPMFEGVWKEDFPNVSLDARLVRLGEKKDGRYEYVQDYYMSVPEEHHNLPTDYYYSAIGFNKPEYSATDHRFFWRTIEDGEELEYELLFVIDKDIVEENVVLEFDSSGNSGTIYSDSLNGSYFAIK